MEEQQFRRACSRFPTGVTIATVMLDDGTPRGLTVSSFTSVSLDPPQILICLHQNSRLLPFFHAGWFGVNVLAEQQRELSVRFARHETRDFHLLDWHPGFTGAPLLAGALAAFECQLRQAIVSGDHEILIGDVMALSSTGGQNEPLVRFAGAYCGIREGTEDRDGRFTKRSEVWSADTQEVRGV